MGLQGCAFQANIFIEDMVFLGDTRSAEELAVFTNMAPERLCLGRRLKPDVRDPPEDVSADVDMCHLNNGRRGGLLHGGREPMRG